MLGTLETPNINVHGPTPSIAGLVDIYSGGVSTPASLGFGLHVCNTLGTAHCHFAWDRNGFSLYRADGGDGVVITTVMNGRLTVL